MIPADVRCVRCHLRWKQEKNGLCRACYRADQLTDPVALAVIRLRKFIGRTYAAVHVDRETIIAANEAASALDLLVERLRDRALGVPA